MPRIIRVMKRLLGLTITVAALLLAGVPAYGSVPTATFHDISVIEGTGGTTNAQFTVVSSAPLGYDVYYDVTITPGTAKADDDYTVPVSTSFILTAGTTTATYSVPIVTDAVREDDETFSVTIADHYGNGPLLDKTTAICTIVNDDAGFFPDHALMPVGGSSKVRFDFGTTLASGGYLTFSTTDANVIPARPAQAVPPGSRSIDVFVVPSGEGNALLTGFLSNGASGSMAITAYTDRTIVINPSALGIRTGLTVQVSVALDPPAGSPQTVSLAPADPGIIEVPDTITVPAGGSVRVPVHGIALGQTSLAFTIVGRSAGIPIRVSPFELAIDAITPATGGFSGGTRVEISGTGFSDSCRVTFDGIAATPNPFTGGKLVVLTPPHAPGNVDVRVVCRVQETTLIDGFGYVRAKRRIAGR